MSELKGQSVLVIGGSSGIGLATARLAREAGADVIITARDAERLGQVGEELGASTVAFDATDFGRLRTFFNELPTLIDDVFVTGPGPSYVSAADFDPDAARRDLEAHILLPVEVARAAAERVRPSGTLLFMGATGARHVARGTSLASTIAAGQPALVRSLALELAPVRVNLIAAGFVNSPLSARILGDQLEARLQELRTTLPIRRVIRPDDIAAAALHLMTKTAASPGRRST